MRARQAKKLLKQLLSSEIAAVTVPPGGALAIKSQLRGDDVLDLAREVQAIVQAPVIVLPPGVDVSVVTML